MTRAKPWLVVIAVSLLLLAGCLPGDMPAYVNDGKTIVAVAADANGKKVLWTVDVQTSKATPHSVPGDWDVRMAKMLDDQVWVEWEAIVKDAYGNRIAAESTWKRFDPVKNEFLDGPPGMEDGDWPRVVIPASHEGRKCLFYPPGDDADPDGKKVYDVFSLPDLKKTTAVKLNNVVPVGGFWWVSISMGVEVYNQESKRVLMIPQDELLKMKADHGIPYTRINEGEKALFLAWETKQGGMDFTYGVFDINSGKFLWGGSTKDALRGNPVFNRNEIWSLQKVQGGIGLIRHTPGENLNESKQETIYSVNSLLAGEYNPSPDRSQFLITVGGKPSRLLFIPVKEGVTEKDVKVVELVEKKQ